MDRNTALIWSSLNFLTKERYDTLIKAFGTLECALSRISATFLRELGCREETVPKVLQRLQSFWPDQYGKELSDRGIRLITIEDETYPKMLREIGDPPVFLHVLGDCTILDRPCVACVGTRAMSSYGQRVTESFVPTFVHAGLVTISGLAIGVDALVARTTIDAGGPTVAVLGHGLSAIYPPRHTALAKEIIDRGGLLLTEYPLDQPPDKHTFPGRNRIIAGLSRGTLVLEAGAESGAIITAELALEYGRDVFVVPGSVFDDGYAGCHALLSEGSARLVTKPQEVLSELGMVSPSRRPGMHFVPADGPEASLYAILSGMPQDVDDLVEASGDSVGTISALLTVMELKGIVKNVGDGWVRTG